MRLAELVALGLAVAAPPSAEPPSAEAPAVEAPSAEAPRDLAALMTTLASVQTLEARFVEKKDMALFDAPLVTEGRMAFRAPGTLARIVTSPRPTRVLVTETALVTESGGRVERLDLGARPEARALVTALLSLLRGDLDALKASFQVEYAVIERARWRLTLTPSSERVKALVAGLEFAGRGVSLERYVVREASGDVAVTEVSDVRTGVSFDAAEAERWFGAP